MVRAMNIKPTRRWRSTSPTRGAVDKAKNERLNANKKPERLFQDVVVDTNALRKSRSSSYSKFRYPEQFHSSPFNRHLTIEERIPACLRKFPRYINQPKRHSCGYTPPGGKSVSFVASHSIHSSSIPPRLPTDKKTKKATTTTTATSHDNLYSSHEMLHNQYADVIGRSDSARDDGDDASELQRNATYSYVYTGQSDVTVDMNDADGDDRGDDRQSIHSYNSQDFEQSDDDDVPLTSTFKRRTDDTQSNNRRHDVRAASATNAKQNSKRRTHTSNDAASVRSADDDEIVEEFVSGGSDRENGAVDGYLPRTASEERFEALMNNITRRPTTAATTSPPPEDARTPSPSRPHAPTHEFSDDSDPHVANVLDRPISPQYSDDDDDESIPEDIPGMRHADLL